MHADHTFTEKAVTSPPSRRQTIDSPAVYYHGSDVTDRRFVARPIEFKRQTASVQRIPGSTLPPLETRIPLSSHSGLEWGAMGWSGPARTRGLTEGRNLRLVLIATTPAGYDRLLIFRGTGLRPLAAIRAGEWSGSLKDSFLMENGRRVPGHFRFKLLQLEPDASRVVLYRTKIYKTHGWASSRKTEKEITRHVGPFIYGFEQGAGYCDIELCLEHVRLQSEYYVRLAEYAKQKQGCDFMMIKIHVQDALNHWLLNEFVPDWPLYDRKTARRCAAQYAQSYEAVDELVGELVRRVADRGTVVAVASDHGAVPILRKVDYRPIFIQAGLLRFKKKRGGFVVDLDRSRMVMVGDQIFVNLKRREKRGTVTRAEYEGVRSEIISVLTATRDPATGECPFEMVCRREDLEMHGVWGERYGDVIPVVKTGYWLIGGEILPHAPSRENPARLPAVSANNERPVCGTHFGVMPNAAHGLMSNHAWFLAAGPGIRRGHLRQKCASPTAVAPTLCKALSLREPAHCEGQPLCDFFTQRRSTRD